MLPRYIESVCENYTWVMGLGVPCRGTSQELRNRVEMSGPLSFSIPLEKHRQTKTILESNESPLAGP